MPHSSVSAPLRGLVVATANPGKLREFQALLAGLPFGLTSLAALRLSSPEESGVTFLENATLKARHAAERSGLAAVADDSGLEVDALGGAPGLFSARYAGAQGDDAANNAKLIRELDGVPMQKRKARYKCCVVFVNSAADLEPLAAEGAWEGFILEAPRGSGGFGYDSYFWLPELDMSAAELAPEEKNRLSHRGQALRQLRNLLAARMPTVSE
jgi:XTP/dITP diphosphohydrolase